MWILNDGWPLAEGSEDDCKEHRYATQNTPRRTGNRRPPPNLDLVRPENSHGTPKFIPVSVDLVAPGCRVSRTVLKHVG